MTGDLQPIATYIRQTGKHRTTFLLFIKSTAYNILQNHTLTWSVIRFHCFSLLQDSNTVIPPKSFDCIWNGIKLYFLI